MKRDDIQNKVDDLLEQSQKPKANRQLKEEALNQLNEAAFQKYIQLKKIGADQKHIDSLRVMAQNGRDAINKKFADSFSRLNEGESIPIKGGTTLGELPQQNLPDAAKQVNLGKEDLYKKSDIPNWKKNLQNTASEAADALKRKTAGASEVASELAERLGKKGLKSIPLFGGLAAAMANKDAMAAAGSIPVVGEAFDAEALGRGSDEVKDAPAFPTYQDPKDHIMQRKIAQQDNQNQIDHQASLNDFSKYLSGEKALSPQPEIPEDDEQNNLSRFSRLQKQMGR